MCFFFLFLFQETAVHDQVKPLQAQTCYYIPSKSFICHRGLLNIPVELQKKYLFT